MLEQSSPTEGQGKWQEAELSWGFWAENHVVVGGEKRNGKAVALPFWEQ